MSAETNEATTFCDCCEEPHFWEDLATGDDGETWICPKCVAAMGRPKTIVEQLDAAQSGDEFAQVLGSLFGALESARDEDA